MRTNFLNSTICLFLLWLFSITIFGLVGALFNDYVKGILLQVGNGLAPALLFAHWFYKGFFLDELRIRNFGKRADYGWFVLLFAVSIPIAGYLENLNNAMSLPESMEAIEAWFRKMELQAMDGILKQLSATTFSEFLFALLAVAVAPAICEEALFRGVILNNMLKRTSKVHLSVWLSAAFFSFIHFQFFGFLPRMFMGALLGYAFVYSKSLWMPILLHFLNNAIAVVAYYAFQKGRVLEDPLTTQIAVPVWMVVLSLLVSVGVMMHIARSRHVERA